MSSELRIEGGVLDVFLRVGLAYASDFRVALRKELLIFLGTCIPDKLLLSFRTDVDGLDRTSQVSNMRMFIALQHMVWQSSIGRFGGDSARDCGFGLGGASEG